MSANDIQQIDRAGGITSSEGQPSDRNARLMLPMPFKLPIRPSRVATVRNGDGRMETFALGAAGLIFRRRQTTAGGASYQDWDQLGGAMTAWTALDGGLSTIATTRNTDGRIEMFGTTATGEVYTRGQGSPGGLFGAWVKLDGIMNAVAAETNADGSTVLFAVNPAGRIFQRRRAYPSAAWTGWLLPLTSPPPS